MNRINKIEKLLQMAKKISYDELVMISGHDENDLNAIITELEVNGIIKINGESIIYTGIDKVSKIAGITKKYRKMELDQIEDLSLDTAPEWAIMKLRLYKKMFNDSKDLKKSVKLKFFIEKFCNTNDIEPMAQTTFLELRAEFIENGEEKFLKKHIIKPQNTHKLINKLYEFYKSEYLSTDKPSVERSVALAREKFYKYYPELPRRQFIPLTELTKRLQQEFSRQEIIYYRNNIKFTKDNFKPKKRVRSYHVKPKPVLLQFKSTPNFLTCFLSDILYDLQRVLRKNSEAIQSSHLIKGDKYEFKFNNKFARKRNFRNPEKFLNYILILSHIQAQKQKTDGFTKSSTDEILLFRGKKFHKTKKNKTYSYCIEAKKVIMEELEILQNISFYTDGKYEPIIELKPLDEENLHEKYNFFFKIYEDIIQEDHLVSKEIFSFNTRNNFRAMRLGYYLDKRWKEQEFLTPISISELMNSIDIDKKSLQSRQKESDAKRMLENNLDIIKEAGIIQSWHYYDWEQNYKKKWFSVWEKSHVIIEPPKYALRFYSNSNDIINFCDKKLSKYIADNGILQKEISEAINISPVTLVKLNKGGQLRDSILIKIKSFCEKHKKELKG